MMKKIIGTVLKYGDKGPKVKEAQEMLRSAGSKIKVNGEFTIGMITAVKSFQSKNKLKVTGVIGNPTWEKLLAVDFAARAKSAKKPAKKPTKKPAARKTAKK